MTRFICVCLVLVCTGLLSALHSDGNGCGCPDTWIPFGGSCYLFADNVKLSWSEAAHFCELHHSSLVVIDNRNEDLFLQDHSLKLFRNAADRHSQQPSFWTGATDEIVEGIWTWYTDDSELGYLNWQPGQPDSHHGVDEDCLFLYGYSNFTWNDGPCTLQCFPICEIKNLLAECKKAWIWIRRRVTRRLIWTQSVCLCYCGRE